MDKDTWRAVSIGGAIGGAIWFVIRHILAERAYKKQMGQMADDIMRKIKVLDNRCDRLAEE